MGTDIHIFREVRINGEWKCCEPVFGNKAKERYGGDMPETAAEEMNYGRWYLLFSLLTETRGSLGDCMSVADFPSRVTNGMPDDVSSEVRTHVEFVNKDAENCTHGLHNLYISEMMAYLKHYHDEMLLTGNLPVDIVNADDEMSEAYKLINRFDTGCFKGSEQEVERRMQLYEYIWNTYNPIIEFIRFMDNEPCTGEFNGTFGDIAPIDRRIIFYFDC